MINCFRIDKSILTWYNNEKGYHSSLGYSSPPLEMEMKTKEGFSKKVALKKIRPNFCRYQAFDPKKPNWQRSSGHQKKHRKSRKNRPKDPLKRIKNHKKKSLENLFPRILLVSRILVKISLLRNMPKHI